MAERCGASVSCTSAPLGGWVRAALMVGNLRQRGLAAQVEKESQGLIVNRQAQLTSSPSTRGQHLYIEVPQVT